MNIFLTGAAGFIGFHVARALLDRGDRVVGVDSLTPYYPVALKRDRLAQLAGRNRWRFVEADIADRAAMDRLAAEEGPFDAIVHLAAQAGVRYSLENPYAYVHANLMGHLVILEMARHMAGLGHLVYASSSSVYGANETLPWSEDQPTERPLSVYGATKQAGERLAHSYASLYRVPTTGLRFFTVYGPWGRPDMAPMLFAKAIVEGTPIRLFNRGEMWRDFTYIDDIVAGVVAAIDRPPAEPGEGGGPPVAVYNLGNNRSEKLTDFVGELERALGRRAVIQPEAMQPGDVPATYADITRSARDLGFRPATPISEGVPRFVAWFRDYYDLT